MSADCTIVRAAVAELALGVLAGSERADVLHHLDGCADCRRAVGELSATADRLLGVAAPLDPPTGFESRVVERLAAAAAPRSASRRRPWPLAVGAAALAAALAAFVVGVQVGDGRTGAGDLPEAADPAGGARRLSLRTGGGEVGEIVLLAADGGRAARLVCVLDAPGVVGAYRIMVLDDTGATVASWAVTPGATRPWSWSTALPVDPDEVRRVDLAGPDGLVRASTG